jgi:hypothetical protein
MNGTEIRQLNAEDAAEYQAVFLGALQSAPTAFAADYGPVFPPRAISGDPDP